MDFNPVRALFGVGFLVFVILVFVLSKIWNNFVFNLTRELLFLFYVSLWTISIFLEYLKHHVYGILDVLDFPILKVDPFQDDLVECLLRLVAVGLIRHTLVK